MEPAPAEDWREIALREALTAEARYGQGTDAMLRCIRVAAPECTAFTISPDRQQLVRFLESKTTDCRSLVRGEMRDGEIIYGDVTTSRLYLGWFAAEWEGRTIEVALTPNSSSCGAAICLGSDTALLTRFVETLRNFCNRPLGRCLRYSEGWDSAPDLDAEVCKVTWDDIILPDALLSALRETADGFFTRREAYARLGFAWRRGLLLVGPPGTGKTMVCKAIAAALPSLPFLYVRDLRDRDQEESMKAIFRRARQLAPCILAFEDIDGLVNEQNRSVFLNEMDGFENNEGLLVIASSNHPGKIDEALLKRPSRFDRVLHLGLPAEPERLRYCEAILARFTRAGHLPADFDSAPLATEAAQRSDGFTPAYLKEAFLAAALQQAHAGQSHLGIDFGKAVLAQLHTLREQMRALKDPESLASMRGEDSAVGFRPPRRGI